MGTQNGHNVPFLKSASLKKRKSVESEISDFIHDACGIFFLRGGGGGGGVV